MILQNNVLDNISPSNIFSNFDFSSNFQFQVAMLLLAAESIGGLINPYVAGG